MNKKEKWKCTTVEIIQKEKNGIVCVTVKGGIEAELVPEFEKKIKKIVESDKRRLLFDLGALEYLQSSIVRVILNAAKEINQKSGKIILCSLDGYIKEIFEVNCIQDTIAMADSVESGIKKLLRPLKAA
ncbi:MAG: STAS domain-containing protein [Desulfobacterales bacterium]|jgi:anti-anti-sigma factor